MKKISIYIDESGTLPDIKDKVIILVAVGFTNSGEILSIIKSLREDLKNKKELTEEIKFYNSGQKTKTKFLTKLSNTQIEMFILVIDKNDQKIPDTPQNYAILSWLLIQECLVFYKKEDIEELIFDRHFHRDIDIKKFNKLFYDLMKIRFPISHVNSKENPLVNIADMVAGAVFSDKTGKSNKYYKIIKDRIISEVTLNWKEAKRKIFAKKNV